MHRLPTFASKSWTGLIAPRYWPSWVGFGLARLISLLPLPVIAVVGGILGELLFLIIPSRRRITLRNIGSCFPHLSRFQVWRLARKNYRAMSQAIFDTGISWWSSDARLKRLTRYRNRQVYDQALANDRPIILLMGHFIVMEVGGLALSMERPLIDIYKAPSNPVAHLLAVRGLNRSGFATLIEKSEGLKPVVRAMRDGEPLCYLPDQDQGTSNSVFVPFFGIQSATLNLLGKLTKMTNAVVIPCFARQLPWGQGYEVSFEAPLENFPVGDEVADATRMNQVIENAVRKMPDQYFWVHKRFKTRPEGEPDFYRGD
jgi:KDO2-lipid IV(A) lauroyltransferase